MPPKSQALYLPLYVGGGGGGEGGGGGGGGWGGGGRGGGGGARGGQSPFVSDTGGHKIKIRSCVIGTLSYHLSYR